MVNYREIEGFAGQYLISDTGVVYSNKRATVIKPRIDKDGYELVTLWFHSESYTKKVHRLVAIAFIPNPLELLTVNHKDGIKTNNCVENLEWLTIGDNHRHAFKTGLHTIGESRTAGRPVKLKNSDILEIRNLIKEGLGNTAIGKLYGVSCGCIYSIRVGKSWTHI
jgi:hypothetical protein